jgi:hypothetical protein
MDEGHRGFDRTDLDGAGSGIPSNSLHGKSMFAGGIAHGLLPAAKPESLGIGVRLRSSACTKRHPCKKGVSDDDDCDPPSQDVLDGARHPPIK